MYLSLVGGGTFEYSTRYDRTYSFYDDEIRNTVHEKYQMEKCISLLLLVPYEILH